MLFYIWSLTVCGLIQQCFSSCKSKRYTGIVSGLWGQVFGFLSSQRSLEHAEKNNTISMAVISFSFSISGPSNHHSQSTLRPPLPPPHNHSLSHHHSSANSLNRNSLTNRRNQIHAPAPAPNDLATTPESVQLQDSWVLNSNVPLETRWVAGPGSALQCPSADEGF